MLTHLSLFSGIGGIDIAAEWAGFVTVGQCEMAEYPYRVLCKHWPNVPKWRDVRDVTADSVRAAGISRVDVLSGGFPCQDISNAGKRAGLSGARSGLWREMVRAVRMVGPRYVLVENVAALLGRGMGTVLGDLAESGYDAEWDCLPASAFGSYHERDRVFIVAYPKGEYGQARSVLEASEDWRSSAQSGRLHRMVVAERGKQPGERLESEPGVDRMVHGIPHRTHRLAALGNAVYPPVVRWILGRIRAAMGV
ncbi:DNA cytosine methyltransferase [Alicyclobacillus macrosporangiidus]